MKKILLCVSMMAVLAACGGSVSGDGGDEPNAFAFDDPDVAFFDALQIIKAANLEPATAFVDIEPLGSATYQGYATVRLNDGTESQAMIGTFELEADFVGNEISGSATEFMETAPTRDVSGVLSITNGTIFDNAGSAQFVADVDGRLQDGGTRIDIDTTLDGSISGVGADYVFGTTGSAAVAEVTTVSGGASIQDLRLLLIGESQ